MTSSESSRKHQDKLASIDQQLDEALAKIDWERRRNAEADIVSWVNAYCIGPILDETPPPLGEEILREMHRAITDPTSKPYMIAIARGSGKTSYIECVVMYALATGQKKFPVIISQNATSAQNILQDLFRIVMDANTPFAQDYPTLCIPFQITNGSFRRRQTYKGVATEICRNASRVVFARLVKDDGTEYATSGSCIYTRGITSGLRGMKNHTLRPDVAVVDDIQTSETAESQEQVEKLLAIIQKDVFNLSGKGKIQVLQTGTPISADDLVERIMHDRNWKVTKYPAIIKFPTDIEENPDNGLWTEYFRIYDEENAKDGSHERSLKFYRRHRKKMDRGSQVLNPKRFKESDGHLSALQALLEKRHLIGDSAFWSEFMMEPKRVSLSLNITPKHIFSNINANYPRCVVPDGFIFTCAAVDLNTSYGATCVVKCYKTDSTSAVLYHKVFKMDVDQQLNAIQYNAEVYNHLSVIGKTLMMLGMKIDALGIDGGGRNLSAVCEFAKNCFRLCGIPACCMIGRAATNFNPLVRSRLRNAVGHTVLCGDDKEHIKAGAGKKWLFFDSDWCKECEQRALMSEPGSPGGTSLYDDLALNHMDFANGVCNERIKWKKALSNGRTEYSWISKEPHDFLDCLAMCRAIAESEGLSATMPHRVSQTSHTPHTVQASHTVQTVQAVQATATPIAASPSRISLLRRKMALSRKRVRIV